MTRDKITFLMNYFFVLLVALALSLLYLTQVISTELVLVFGILALGLFPLCKTIINKQLEPLTPKTILPFTYFLYATGPLFHKGSYSVTTVNTYLMLQLLGLLALIIGLNVPRKTSSNISNSQPNRDVYVLKWATFVMAIFGAVSTLSEIVSFGGISSMLAVGYGGDRFLHFNNSFTIGGGLQWLVLSGIIAWYYGVKRLSKEVRLFAQILTGISVLLLLFMGERSTLVYSAIFGCVIYYYERRTIGNKLIFLALIIGISGAQLFSNARYYLPLGLVEATRFTFSLFKNNPQMFVPLPSNINEFRSPARSLLHLIEYGKGKNLFGTSYIASVGSLFPFVSRIFASLGDNPSMWYMQQYHPDVLSKGGGMGFSPLSEGFMNFGTLGVIIHMFIYGWVITKIYHNYKCKRNVGSLLLYAGALPIFALDGLRINLSSMLYKLSRIYLMPYLIFLVLSLLFKKRTNISTAIPF